MMVQEELAASDGWQLSVSVKGSGSVMLLKVMGVVVLVFCTVTGCEALAMFWIWLPKGKDPGLTVMVDGAKEIL